MTSPKSMASLSPLRGRGHAPRSTYRLAQWSIQVFAFVSGVTAAIVAVSDDLLFGYGLVECFENYLFLIGLAPCVQKNLHRTTTNKWPDLVITGFEQTILLNRGYGLAFWSINH